MPTFVQDVIVPHEMQQVFNATYGRETTGRECIFVSEPGLKSLEAALRWFVDELGKSEGNAPMLNGTYQDGWNGAWRHIRRMFLRSRPVEPEAFGGFMECDTCRAKPGSPPLCAGCLHNREVINAYERKNHQPR